jgi:CubicO group peptidase (beta-lactamase class C family)
MKNAFWILACLYTSTFSSYGQNIEPLKLDSFLNTLGSKNLAMGSLAISVRGINQYQKAIGYSFIDSNKKVFANINTKYRIGSATKMFTAVMIFQLLEEGKIRLHDKLGLYFPDLPNADKITLQNMLYHRSGLHDYTHETDFQVWMDRPKSHEDLLKIIKEKGVDFEPDSKADYSNTNYLLLGYIIEKICKMPYSQALKTRITSKLNLKNTYFGKGMEVEDNESTSYKYAQNQWVKQKATDLSIHGGAGSIVSTPTDMVKFMDALFSRKLINQTSLSLMGTMVDDYGMGMFPNKYGDKPSYGHNGRIEEFYSALWYFPNQKLSIAYCTNGIDYPRTDIMEGILKICFHEPFSIPFSKNNKYPSDDLNKYPGNYSSGQIKVKCTREGDKLFLETRGKVFELEQINNHYFMNEPAGYFFEFFPEIGELQIKETDNIYYLKRTN